MANWWQRTFGKPAQISQRGPESDVLDRAYALGLDVADQSFNFAGRNG